MRFKQLLVGLVSLSLLLSSCATLHDVPLPPRPGQAVPDIHSGDRVIVTLRDGQRHDLEVESVATDRFMGRAKHAEYATQVLYADLQSLQVYKRGKAAKAGITAIVVVGLLVVAAGAAILHYVKEDKKSD